ncbi:MAG: hypothetical protein ABIS14_12715 [Sphingomonas sp.]
MHRYEITGTATDVFSLAAIQNALRTAGARRIGRRHAFGWSNQPPVATFAADSEAEAKRVCDAARALLPNPESGLPALLPFEYGRAA